MGEEENALPSRQCTGSHVPEGQFNEFRYELLPHPAYSPEFSPLRLFLISKPEEMVRRKEIHHQRAKSSCLFRKETEKNSSWKVLRDIQNTQRGSRCFLSNVDPLCVYDKNHSLQSTLFSSRISLGFAWVI